MEFARGQQGERDEVSAQRILRAVPVRGSPLITAPAGSPRGLGLPTRERAEGMCVWEAASVSAGAPLSSLLDPLCHSA